MHSIGESFLCKQWTRTLPNEHMVGERRYNVGVARRGYFASQPVWYENARTVHYINPLPRFKGDVNNIICLI